MKIEEHVPIELPAMVIGAQSASGGIDETYISWHDLRNAAIGTKWVSEGCGELYYERQSATLVYRDEELAALVLSREYEERGRQRESEDVLQAFRIGEKKFSHYLLDTW